MQSDKVDIIIGTEDADLLAGEEVAGLETEPIAKLTPLGWVAMGRLTPSVAPQADKNFLSRAINAAKAKFVRSMRKDLDDT